MNVQNFRYIFLIAREYRCFGFKKKSSRLNDKDRDERKSIIVNFRFSRYLSLDFLIVGV